MIPLFGKIQMKLKHFDLGIFVTENVFAENWGGKMFSGGLAGSKIRGINFFGPGGAEK